MKKTFVLILCIIFVLSGCSKQKNPPAPKQETIEKPVESTAATTPAPPPAETESEFYKMATNPNRTIAVMIDNDNSSARPQIGLEDAFIVYEIIVEGGATRFMALFKNYDIEKVGPVRSSRHYFLDYALENDAIYAHAGWSPQAQRDISNLGVNNINGLNGGDEINYWRDNTYDNSWHNMYTSVKKLVQYSENTKGYSMDAGDNVLEFSKNDKAADGEDCTNIKLTYSTLYNVGYSYNADTDMYERSIGGKPHMSQTGNVFSAKNIIIYKVSNYDLNDGENKGRQNLSNIGSGEGWYVSGGKVEPITWSKQGRTSKTEYKKADGTPLVANPGVTFIQIMPQGNTVSLE